MTPPAPQSDPYPEAIVSPGETESDGLVYKKYEGWYEDAQVINDLPKADDFQPNSDLYIDAKVLLPKTANTGRKTIWHIQSEPNAEHQRVQGYVPIWLSIQVYCKHNSQEYILPS